MKGEYHSGWSLPGAIRKSAPSEDWWSVDNTTPKAVSPMVISTARRRRPFQPSHSKSAGVNSRASTVR